MIRVLFTILVFIPFSSNAPAPDKNAYHQLTLKGIEYGYNMQIEKAAEVFDQLIKLDPQNPLSYVLQSVNHFYMLQWRASEAVENKFKKLTSKAIQLSKRNLSKKEKRLDALFYLGTIHIYLAAYHGRQSNWLRAFWYGKDGIDFLKKIVAIDPNYYDAYLGLGLYHYYADVLPQFIKRVTAIFGIEGDRERGLKQLQLAAEHGKYSQAEAMLILGNIYLYTEKQPEKALQYSEKLANLYPANSGFLSFLGENYQRKGDHSLAIESFKSGLAQEAVQRYPIFKISLFYNLGNTYFEMNEFEEATSFYQQTLAVNASMSKIQKGILALANYKIGLCYDMVGRHEDAVKKYQQVKKSQNDRAYKLARERLNKPMTLVARDLILGTNFTKTKSSEEGIETFEQALKKCKLNSEDYPESKIPELRYHLAKTKFEKKGIQSAISDFKEIMALKNVEEKWIKPWSHFYLGQCFEETGEFQSALDEYAVAYKLDDSELRFQIDRSREELQKKPEPNRGFESYDVK